MCYYKLWDQGLIFNCFLNDYVPFCERNFSEKVRPPVLIFRMYTPGVKFFGRG